MQSYFFTEMNYQTLSTENSILCNSLCDLKIFKWGEEDGLGPQEPLPLLQPRVYVRERTGADHMLALIV